MVEVFDTNQPLTTRTVSRITCLLSLRVVGGVSGMDQHAHVDFAEICTYILLLRQAAKRKNTDNFIRLITYSLN